MSATQGGEATDNTLPAITKLIDDLVHSGLTVPEYLKRSPATDPLRFQSTNILKESHSVYSFL